MSVQEARDAAVAPAPEGLARACLRQARPRQWLKNALVLAAPAAAGELGSAASLGRVLVAFAAFCLAASGTYYLNDLLDRHADRLHPVKRLRPVAAGLVPEPLAWTAAALLPLAALAVASASGHWQLLVVVACYTALTASYSRWLKHMAAVDLVAVAGGFVLRAVGGAAAVDVPVSRWFLIVTSLGALFVVAGKRRAELRTLGDRAVQVRPSHADYSLAYLTYVEATTSGAALVSYCLWAFERQGQTGAHVPFFVLSVLPFLLGVLRYALLVDGGAGEEPEEVALRDRPLLVCGAALVSLLLLGVSTA